MRTKSLFLAVAAWTGLGLLSGLYYRELTRSSDFTGFTQLAVAHTHFLVLGTVIGLLLLILEHIFQLSRSRMFTWGFWTWILGTALTAGMQTFKGTLQVQGSAAATSKALAGISGMGHILLTVALGLLLGALWKQLPSKATSTAASSVRDAEEAQLV